MKRISSIIWGLVLIAVSAVLVLNAFEITSIDIFFDGWWTLFIIVPCAIGLFTDKDKTGSIIGLFIGVFLLLCCLDILSFEMLWKLALPAIIIIIGVKMIFGGIFNSKSNEVLAKIKENGGSLKNTSAIFSGQDLNFDGEAFEGAELNAIFGGIKCDLRNAVFEGDTTINACCIFGGTDILLPQNVNIKVNSNSIFGGIDSKKHQNSKDNQYTVYLNGTCIFGGVDVK